MSEIPITDPLETKKPVVSVCVIAIALLITIYLPLSGAVLLSLSAAPYFSLMLVIWTIALIVAWIMKDK